MKVPLTHPGPRGKWYSSELLPGMEEVVSITACGPDNAVPQGGDDLNVPRLELVDTNEQKS